VRLTFSGIMGVTVALVSSGYLAILQFGPDDPQFVKFSVLVLIGVCGGMAALVSIMYVRQIRRQPFTNRESLTSEDIFSTYYKESVVRDEMFIRLWTEIAALLALPAEKLRPTDRFDQELKPLDHWEFYDDHLEHLFAWVSRYADQHGAKINLQEFTTLDDVVRYLARLQAR
jgi:hypothetical protein